MAKFKTKSTKALEKKLSNPMSTRKARSTNLNTGKKLPFSTKIG